MGPTECKGHLALAKASESLVGAIAIADDDRVEESVAEQLLRRLGAARGVDMERDRVIADLETHSQARLERSSPRSSWTRQLVSSAWRSAALFWCARIASASGSNSWHEAASGCRPASPARPSALGRTSTRHTRCTGREAGTVLEQEACPEAGPVERPGEQLCGTGGADTSMGDDAHSQVRRQRGRRITRL